MVPLKTCTRRYPVITRSHTKLPQMKKKLTEAAVEKWSPPKEGRLEIHDAYMPALILRITDSGKKTWSLQYRVAGEGPGGIRGKLRRMTLGTYPVVKLGPARDLARDKLQIADKGEDPGAQKKEDIQTRSQRTFETVCNKFIAGEAKPNVDTWRNIERLLTRHAVPAWQGRQVDSITRADVHELLDELKENKPPSVSREVRKHLSKLFNWMVDRGLIVASPVAGMRRPDLVATARDRSLEMDELVGLWLASEELTYPFGPFFRLLMLTGQRRTEIASARRSWLRTDLRMQDVPSNLRVLEIPAEFYKTGRPQVVPFPLRAWLEVENLPRFKGDHLLSSTAGVRPISGYSKAKLALEKHRSVEQWRIHDLRRSAATHMARLGVSQEHIERVLGHAIGGVAGTYNRYSYLKEKHDALAKWGNELGLAVARAKAQRAFVNVLGERDRIRTLSQYKDQLRKITTQKGLRAAPAEVQNTWAGCEDDDPAFAALPFEQKKRVFLDLIDIPRPGQPSFEPYEAAAFPLLDSWALNTDPPQKVAATKYSTSRPTESEEVESASGTVLSPSPAVRFLMEEFKRLDEALGLEPREVDAYLNSASGAASAFNKQRGGGTTDQPAA